jgi:hypothetical protein
MPLLGSRGAGSAKGFAGGGFGQVEQSLNQVIIEFIHLQGQELLQLQMQENHPDQIP